MTPPDPSGPPPPLLPLRSALVFLLGVLSGLFAAVLTRLGGAEPATAVLVGLSVVAPAVIFFDRIIH